MDLLVDTFDHRFKTVLLTAPGAVKSPGRPMKVLFARVVHGGCNTTMDPDGSNSVQLLRRMRVSCDLDHDVRLLTAALDRPHGAEVGEDSMHPPLQAFSDRSPCPDRNKDSERPLGNVNPALGCIADPSASAQPGQMVESEVFAWRAGDRISGARSWSRATRCRCGWRALGQPSRNATNDAMELIRNESERTSWSGQA